MTDIICSDLPCADPTDVDDPEAYMQAVNAVIKTGVPNHKGTRIPLRSSFDWDFLKENSKDYHDKSLVDYITFGFPLGLVSDHIIKSNPTDNHSPARNFTSPVDDYIHTELNEAALLGPFKESPHENYTWSPHMTHPKGDGHRVILDMSFGSHSVNYNTDTSLYDGLPFILKLPNLDSILPQLEQFDQEACLFKIDISCVFRNVHIDPGDAIHLGIRWKNQYFLDKNLAFGAVHGTAIFQRITDFVRFLMAKRGFVVHIYIDDIYALCHKDQADQTFEILKEILHGIGLPLN